MRTVSRQRNEGGLESRGAGINSITSKPAAAGPGVKTAMNRITRQAMLASTAVLAVAVATPNAFAAQTGATPTEATVATIVVTAERRAENLQRAPIAVANFSGAQLSAAGVDTTTDLQLHTPGLVISSNTIQSEVYIRGIGTDIASIAADPSVAFLMDGVYLPRLSSAMQDLYDIDRVEVIKGPQGTLYGRNATGGVVNIISELPSDRFSVKADALYGNYDQQRYRLTVSGPLGSDFSARVSLLRHSDDGFVKDLFTGSRLDKLDDWAGRATLRYRHGPLDVILSADVSSEGGSPNTVARVISGDAPVVLFGGKVAADPYQTYINSPSKTANVDAGASAKVIYDLGGMTLTSLTAFRQSHVHIKFDSDATQVDFVNLSAGEVSKSYSEDLQLTSEPSKSLDWIAGLYLYREDADSNYTVNLPLFGLNINPVATERTNAIAVYGQGTYHLGDKFRLTAGLRYSDEKKDATLNDLSSGVSVGTFAGSKSWSAFTPKFGVEYLPTEQVTLYATVTRGFKSGGFNSTALQTPQGFNPEYVWSYEAGLKSTLLDNHLRFNADGFYYDYSNLQVNVFNSSSIVTVENAARATIKGLEFETEAVPIRGFTLAANVTLLDAKYGQYISVNPDNPGVGPVNLDGNTMVRAPKFSAGVSGEYAAPIGELGTLTSRVEYFYRSRIFYSPYDLPGVSQAGFGEWNARLAFVPKDKPWHVAAFIKNIGNTLYYQEEARTAGLTGTIGWVGDPRTYGLEVGVSY